MTALPHIQYFLGSNSSTGFYSLYNQLLPPETARAIYILKGGPGCGKSTLMRQVAAQMEAQGIETEYILCSGDPDSLDALVLPKIKVALVDGTAPHVVEPKYPGAVEHYVDLGTCYDKTALWKVRQDIMHCMTGYKGCYARAYRCLGAAAEIFEDQRSALLSDELSQKLSKRARGILKREFSPHSASNKTGSISQRFLGAVTHCGELRLFDTALLQCNRIYELIDNYSLAHDMLVHLLAGAVARGYDIIACPDPMVPDRLAHLIVPQRSLAFLSSSSQFSLPQKPYRRIHLDAAANKDVLRRLRPQIRFSRRVSSALETEAISSLQQAKTMHDNLEAIYNPHVDFDLVGQTADMVSREILSFL